MTNTGVVCEVEIRDAQFRDSSIGPHRFVAVPRVGETVIATQGAEEVRLRVVDVRHIGFPTDEPVDRIRMLEVVETWLTCEKF